MKTIEPMTFCVSQYSSVLVVGLGISGYSVIQHCVDLNVNVSVVDVKKSPVLLSKLKKEYPEVTSYFGGFSKITPTISPLIVVSPGVDLRQDFFSQAKKQGVKIIGDIDLFLAINTKPVIAITGSNGKSTVASLVAHILTETGKKPLLAGNIGIPVLQAVKKQPIYDVVVLELSSFQLEIIEFLRASAATILNIQEDHMDRYASIGEYTLTKMRIFQKAQYKIIPKHDRHLNQINVGEGALKFSTETPTSDTEYGIKQFSNGRYLVKGMKKLIPVSKVPLLGEHNNTNVLAAFALVDFLCLDNNEVMSAISTFKGLEHRMQKVLTHDDVTWVNDSKATNLGASLSAMQSLHSSIVWIAGGKNKGNDFSVLRNLLPWQVKKVILFGEAKKELQQYLPSTIACTLVTNLDEAIHQASCQAKAKDIVLLSPACASFDQFNDFADRGQQFMAKVKNLVQQKERR